MAHSNYSQADTIALARKILQFATQDIADLTNFDASINATYLSQFDTAIQTAESHPDDETIVDIQTGYTEALAEAEKKCRKAYQRLKVFVEKAFPTSRAIQNEFGFNDYANTASIANLIKFMNKVAATATKYSNELVTAAYPMTEIVGFSSFHDQLVTALNAQESYKSERLRLTDERQVLLSEVYAYISYLAKVGKIVYEDNRAKYSRYLLPSISSSLSATSKRISSQAREVVIADVNENDYFSLRVANSGDILQFYIAPNGSTSVPTTAISISPSIISSQFSAEELGFDTTLSIPQSLFVYNPNNMEVSYGVESMT